MDKPFATIKYKTADGSQICVEVSTPVKELLEQSDRQIQSQRRQDRRYLDREDFIDGLTDAAMRYPNQNDPADLVMKMESYRELCIAMRKLSKAQRRRLHLYFICNLTHRQIAEMEGVNRATVSHAIDQALKQLYKHLAN